MNAHSYNLYVSYYHTKKPASFNSINFVTHNDFQSKGFTKVPIAHSALLRSNIDEYFLSHTICIWYLTEIFPSWRTGTTPPIQPNELITPITIEILPNNTDWNSNSIRIIELSKTVLWSTTAVLLIGFTEEGIVSFTDGKNADHAVVVISLFFQLKVHI